jgi:hypothetical protein
LKKAERHASALAGEDAARRWLAQLSWRFDNVFEEVFVVGLVSFHISFKLVTYLI